MTGIHKKAIGNRGEEAAVAFLIAHGFRVVDTNVRPLPGMARGEIDIIAWERDILCFIEVKTRRRPSAQPVEAITPAKRRQLVALAEAYLSLHNLDDIPCRFDVVAVTHSAGTQVVELIRDAFRNE